MSQEELQDRSNGISVGSAVEHHEPWRPGRAGPPGGDALDDVMLYDEGYLAVFEPVILELVDAG